MPYTMTVASDSHSNMYGGVGALVCPLAGRAMIGITSKMSGRPMIVITSMMSTCWSFHDRHHLHDRYHLDLSGNADRSLGCSCDLGHRSNLVASPASNTL